MGTNDGLMSSESSAPPTLTISDNANPGFERSMMYHRTGFAIARVSETCKVDCQGIFR